MATLGASFSIITNPKIIQYLLKGTLFTVIISVVAVLLSILIGSVLALVRNYCNAPENKIFKLLATIYIEVFRNTPLMLWVFIGVVFLPIPKALQEQMETFNNSEGYAKLGVQDFASYVTGYFASLILNVIAYVVTLLLAWLVIRLIIGALGIFTRLPLIRTADRILGAAAGFLQALLIVWGVFLFVSLISATPLGQTLMGQIYESPFLEALYNTNLFLRGASSAMKGIL